MKNLITKFTYLILFLLISSTLSALIIISPFFIPAFFAGEDFKTPIEGMDAITGYRDWKKSKKSRSSLKKAANKKEAITNLVDMLKDLPPSELKTTLDSMGVKEVRAIRTSGLAKDLEGKHPAFPVRDSGGVEYDESGGGPGDIKGLKASIKADEAAFKKGGHPAVAKLRAAQSPDNKMNVMNDLNTKNQTLQGGKSGPIVISSQTNTSTQKSFGGDVNTFSQNQARSNKTLRTSSIQ